MRIFEENKTIMKTIFILSNESRTVKATLCLDESILWEAQGGRSIEVEFSDYTELTTLAQDDTVIVHNEDHDTIATLDIKLRLDEGWDVDDVYLNDTLLSKLNLTKDLTTSIEADSEEIARTQTQNEL